MDLSSRLGSLALILALLGCSSPEVTPGKRPGGNTPTDQVPSGPGETPPPAGERPASAPPSISLPDASAGTPDLPPPAPETCAEENVAATRVPLDVFFLLDGSGSMSSRAGTRSKLELVRDAMNAFLKDPGSAGLGVGVSWFPAVKLCEKEADCPATGVILPGLFPSNRCVGTNAACVIRGSNVVGRFCNLENPTQTTCPAGSTCTKIGRCGDAGGVPGTGFCVPGSANPCTNGGACMPVQRTCALSFGASDCMGTEYMKPLVAFGELPGHLPALGAAIDDRQPNGQTPLAEALTGTLPALKAHMMANPGRRVVLVIASDGVPNQTCMGTAGILAKLEAARTGTPSLTTYAIGVFGGADLMSGRQLITDIARAGGTTQSYVLEPNVNLTETFLKALSEIRGAALPCEFMIPAGREATIDYGKVNLRFRRASGDEIVGYVGSAARCDPQKGGWHYDVDPATGGKPTRIVVCPATCTALKSDSMGKVELRFGCKTLGVD